MDELKSVGPTEKEKVAVNSIRGEETRYFTSSIAKDKTSTSPSNFSGVSFNQRRFRKAHDGWEKEEWLSYVVFRHPQISPSYDLQFVDDEAKEE